MPVVEPIEKAKILNQIDPVKKEYWECWSLKSHRGRQIWEFKLPVFLQNIVLKDEDWNKPEAREFLKKMQEAFVYDKQIQPHSADLVYRTSRLKQTQFEPIKEFSASDSLSEKAYQASKKGFHFYQGIKTDDGNWPGDYGGPLFLLPGMIIVSHLTKTPLPKPYAVLAEQYMFNMQNEDRGWGLHIEGKSTMLGTVLQYVALRLLGAESSDPRIENAKKWIHANGGANYIPSWGKFYLSVLGVYDWKGYNSILPEIWKFPKWLPVHPSKYWCHARMVHMPMAYCYAKKYQGESSEIIESLKAELYTTPYSKVKWRKAKNQFCKKDLYTPHSGLLKLATNLMNVYEKIHLKGLRRSVSTFLLDQMVHENKNTSSINLGPVNHIMNALCLHDAFGKESKEFKDCTERWFDYLWLAEDGMKMNGYNGSQFWDTNFAALALMENGMDKEFPAMAKNVYQWLDDQQIKTEIPDREKYDRCIRKGGWAFSTFEQGWPITDCSAEGMKTFIRYMHSGVLDKEEQTIGKERLKDTVNVLLEYQNKDGGWASYEPTRAPKWVEKLNAAEVFGDIMLDYSYAECTSACLQGLTSFRKEYTDYRTAEIDEAIKRGNAFLKSIQRNDGSWMGSWAVCFTYATWFGIEGLLASGEKDCMTSKTKNHIVKACEFLLSIQKEDGGWGEHFESCVQKKYVEHPQSQVTNTAWAVLGLMAAKHPNKEAIGKGIEFLLSKQDLWGDFPQEQISGVFNFNCMITYTSYRNVFPLWALSRYAKNYSIA
jgi:squalene/oxidosqualene cyclase-like protein